MCSPGAPCLCVSTPVRVGAATHFPVSVAVEGVRLRDGPPPLFRPLGMRFVLPRLLADTERPPLSFSLSHLHTFLKGRRLLLAFVLCLLQVTAFALTQVAHSCSSLTRPAFRPWYSSSPSPHHLPDHFCSGQILTSFDHC